MIEQMKDYCDKLTMMCGSCKHWETPADHRPCNDCPGKHSTLGYEEHPAIVALSELKKSMEAN